MKNKEKQNHLKSFLTNIFSKWILTTIYATINITSMIVAIIIVYYYHSSPYFSLLLSNDSALQYATSISIGVVTLLVTLEVAIRQLFIKSIKIKYFSHTIRNIWTILFFSILFITICLGVSAEAILFAYFSSIAFVCSTLIVFLTDLLKFNVSVLIRSESKKAIKRIKTGKKPNESFGKINNLVREASLTADVNVIKEVLNNGINVLKKLLENKYKLDSKQNDNKTYTTEILKQLYVLHYIATKFSKNEIRENIIKSVILSKCKMVDIIFDFDNGEFIKYALADFEDYMHFFINSEEEASFFAYAFTDDSNTHVEEKIQFLYSLSKMMVYTKGISCISFYDVIFKEFLSKQKCKIDFNTYKLFFDNLIHSISACKVPALHTSNLLEEMWAAAPDDDCKEIIIDFVTFSRSGDYFVNPSFDNYEAIFHFILQTSKKDSSVKDAKFYNIQLHNTVAYIKNAKSIAELFFLPIDDPHVLIRIKDNYVSALHNALKNSGNIHPYIYFKDLNELSEKLTISDKQSQEIIIDIYKNVLISLDDIESKDKIASIISLFESVIENWDKNKVISKDLSVYIVKTIFLTIDVFVTDMSQHASVVYDLTRMFISEKCEEQLAFIKSDRLDFNQLCSEYAYKIGIQAIEYGNNKIIKKSSNFIGWCLIDSIKRCSESCYRKIYRSYARQLFKTLISFNFDENIIYFVATLFVVNFTCCYSYKGCEPQHRFADHEIMQLSEKELKYIRDSIVLRKDDEHTFEIPNYTNNLNAVALTIKKQIDALTSKK